MDKTADGSLLSVRKKLSFESGGEEEDYAEEGEEGDEYGKSWYQYSSSDSDWLQSGGLDGMMSDESARSEPPAAEEEEEDVPSSSPLVAGPAVPAECSSTVAADGPEGSSPHKGIRPSFQSLHSSPLLRAVSYSNGQRVGYNVG